MSTASGNNSSGGNNNLSSKPNSKSRTGCSECKRKRVKCDETKPVCERCRKAKSAGLCDYNLRLSWTEGRPFRKKRRVGGLGDAEVMLRRGRVNGSAIDEGGADTVNSVGDSEEEGPQGVAVSLVSESEAVRASNHVPSLSQPEDAADDGSLGPLAPDSHLHPSDDSLEQVDDSFDSPLVANQQTDLTTTIPSSLSIYPMLTSSNDTPNAYFYLHHLSVHTAVTLFPLLPATSRDFLLSVAASNPYLLSALLAISADQYGRLRGNSNTEIERRASFYSRKALTGLQKALDDPNEATTFPTLATVLALGTQDICMSGNVAGWRTHLSGAKHLLTLAIGAAASSRDSPPVTDSSVLFLVRWFAALDLFTGMSSLSKTLVPDGRYWSVGSPSPAGSKTYIDDFLGFSLELMPILSRISRLARLQQRKSSLTSLSPSSSSPSHPSLKPPSNLYATTTTTTAEFADDLDALIQDTVSSTEAQLIALLTTVCSPSKTPHVRGPLAQETQLSHQLFVHAALLHLYRRVQELPRTHPKPDAATAAIVDIIPRLRVESPASVVVLWPLFSAGCETEDEGRRAVVQTRMVEMRRFGMGNVDLALGAMEMYWERGGGERWDVFFDRMGVDLVLF